MGNYKRRKNKWNFTKILLIVLAIIVSAVVIKNISYIFQDSVEAGENNQNGSKVEANKDKDSKEKDELEEEKRKEEEAKRKEEEEKRKEEEEKRKEEEEKRIEEEKKRQEEEEAKKKEEEENKKTEESGQKIAYLTFDDGPSKKSTPRVLDILDQYDVKATFFVVGNMIEQNPEILKDTYDRGHQIGNHSYGHNYKYLYSSADNFMADIYKTEKLIRSVVGDDFDSKIIRFPGGSFEKRKDPMKKAAIAAGYNYIDWNSLNGDAEGPKRNKTELLNRLKQTTGEQKKLVVLMHDTDAKDTTVEYLASAIEFLKSKGYKFDVLDKNYQ